MAFKKWLYYENISLGVQEVSGEESLMRKIQKIDDHAAPQDYREGQAGKNRPGGEKGFVSRKTGRAGRLRSPSEAEECASSGKKTHRRTEKKPIEMSGHGEGMLWSRRAQGIFSMTGKDGYTGKKRYSSKKRKGGGSISSKWPEPRTICPGTGSHAGEQEPGKCRETQGLSCAEGAPPPWGDFDIEVPRGEKRGILLTMGGGPAYRGGLSRRLQRNV